MPPKKDGKKKRKKTKEELEEERRQAEEAARLAEEGEQRFCGMLLGHARSPLHGPQESDPAAATCPAGISGPACVGRGCMTHVP